MGRGLCDRAVPARGTWIILATPAWSSLLALPALPSLLGCCLLCLLSTRAHFCFHVGPQVKRHQIVHQHYSDIAKLVESDKDAQMSQILRSKRPGAKVRLLSQSCPCTLERIERRC